MKEKKGYRITNRFQEIVSILNKAMKEGRSHVWKTSHRNLMPIIIVKVDIENSSISIHPMNRPTSDFHLGEELFLKLEARDSAFKTTVKEISPKEIELVFPDSIALSEKRKEKRIYFHMTESKMVQLKKLKLNVASYGNRMMDALVSDISMGGLSMILDSKHAKDLEVKDRLGLISLGSYRFQEPINGDIVFKASLGEASEGYKIGLHLDRKIPKVIFERFTSRQNPLGDSIPQITGDEEFRKLVRTRMASVMEAMLKRRNFSRIFESYHLKQSDLSYIRLHVEMLCEVLCGLGVSLGWVTTESMDKLIYVSYLHDSRYFSIPKLALIPSFTEYEKIQQDLTSDEQNVFLEGPLHAAELARHDSEPFPDSYKILIQQKELPDGSGFPEGITTFQFTPLSSLFIVSHYFVDYVLNNRDWSVLDFVKTNEKIFKGQFFKKIFEVMKA